MKVTNLPLIEEMKSRENVQDDFFQEDKWNAQPTA
jgi:hypothetical protein